jgi:hypothetical protein
MNFVFTFSFLWDACRVTFEDNTAGMGEHVAFYGDIMIDGLKLSFTTCNTFVFSPPKPCDDPPPSGTHLYKYVSGNGQCDWEPFAGVLPLECRCNDTAIIDVSTGLCRCLPGYYGNGKSYCFTVKQPTVTRLAVLGRESQVPAMRIAHGLAKDGMENVWMFGGMYPDGKMAEADLYKLDTARYAASACAYTHLLHI